MSEWQHINSSTEARPIMRYRADITAIDVILHSLGGLADTMAMHIDLKSRCWISLINASLPQLAALRQQVPPVSDFYREEQQQGGQLLVSVNTNAFQRQRDAAALVIADLKAALRGIRTELDVWHAQEYGKITLPGEDPQGHDDMSESWKYIERMIWNTYTGSYATLMNEGAPAASAINSSTPPSSHITQMTHMLHTLQTMQPKKNY